MEMTQKGGVSRSVQNETQSCKCHVQTQMPLSQCYFHPLLQKSKQYVMCLLLFFCHTMYNDSHSGDVKKNETCNKMTC